MDSVIYEGERAQDLIEKQLGFSASSLEGCCVVLQDQRLNLLTGDSKKNSEVIHTIIGLSTLASLVPILNNKLSEISKLFKSYEGLNVLKKWNEKFDELTTTLKQKEYEALLNGCDAKEFQSSEILSNAFSKLVKELGIDIDFSVLNPKVCVTHIREAINKRRSENPHLKEINELTSHISSLNDALLLFEKSIARLDNKQNEYNNVVKQYGIKFNDIETVLQSLSVEISFKKGSLNSIIEQNGVLTHSLSLLQSTKEISCCPLCDQPVNVNNLIVHIQSKINETLRKSIESLEQELKELEIKRDTVSKIKNDFREINSNITTITENIVSSFDKVGHFSENYESDIDFFKQYLNLKQPLESIFIALEKLMNVNYRLKNDIESLESRKTAMVVKSSLFSDSIKPLDVSLDKISHYIIPLHEAQRALLEHEARKSITESQSKEFLVVISQVKKFENELMQFKNYLQSKEKDKANQVIEEHGEFFSNFFVKVANNPSYDKINIISKEDRGSIKYDFVAMSTKNPNFTDAAKHVLSGGDLSCACLGLILSLSKGKANKAGFLVLDDPGESFDNVRFENFAREIKNTPNQQTIILTHQKEFAENLRTVGAKFVNI